MSQSTIYRRNVQRYIKLQEKSALDDRPSHMRVLAGLPLLSYFVVSSAEYSARKQNAQNNGVNSSVNAKKQTTSQVDTKTNNQLPFALLGMSGVAMLTSRMRPSIPFVMLHSSYGNQLSSRKWQPRAPRMTSLFMLSATFIAGSVKSLRARSGY